MIAVSNFSDRTVEGAGGSVRPLNARSLALSALLGTHPPTLSSSSLVALAELFGITGGSMRTALSRLAAAGDVSVDDGRYTLAPRLTDRQAAQDAGRRAPAGWNGDWHIAVAVADQRDLPDRRRIRAAMANARFGELRPTVWLRPANLPVPELGRDWITSTGPVDSDDAELAGRIWDLDEMATTAHRLDRALVDSIADVDLADPARIPEMFILSAQVVRFLRTEPLLPSDLTPRGWPVATLRSRYDEYEANLQSMLRPFLRAHSPESSGAS
jgi:phenylacetic acid degradation operon negative regulatory protein